MASRLFKGKGWKKFEEAMETAKDNLGQATASVEAEAAARGLFEAEAAPMYPPPQPTPSMSSSPSTGQQPLVTSHGLLLEAGAPSLSPRLHIDAGRMPESASTQATLASSVSPRIRQTASALRQRQMAAGAAGVPVAPYETVEGSNFGTASTAGGARDASGLGAEPIALTGCSGVAPADIGIPSFVCLVRRHLSPELDVHALVSHL